jgi:uncharacterized protein YndB with AHSA1/START domain
MNKTPPIERSIFIAAPPEVVFPYLTESQKYLLWMGIAAELNPEPGGIFKVDPNGRDVIFGEFIEVVPPRRVVFTWGWDEPHHPMPSGSSRVEIDLTPDNGGTMLRLRHYDVAHTMRDRHERGWSHYLGRLQAVLAGGNPGDDPYARLDVKHS